MGIGKNHTPIIEDTVSTISIADLYEFVKTYDESFTPAPEVTFYIRDKGKDQYLIDFKEDKTPGLSNTAVKKLVGADLSYNYYFIFLTFNISQKIFIFF